MEQFSCGCALDLFQRSDFFVAFRVERQNTVEVKFPLLVKSRI